MNVFTRTESAEVQFVKIILLLYKTLIGGLSYSSKKTKQSIGFFHKQNWAVSTDVKLLRLDETSSIAYSSG